MAARTGSPAGRRAATTPPFASKQFSRSAENLKLLADRAKPFQPREPSALSKNTTSDDLPDKNFLKRHSLRGSTSNPSLRSEVESLQQSPDEVFPIAEENRGSVHSEASTATSERAQQMTVPSLKISGPRDTTTTADMALFTNYEDDRPLSVFEIGECLVFYLFICPPTVPPKTFCLPHSQKMILVIATRKRHSPSIMARIRNRRRNMYSLRQPK